MCFEEGFCSTFFNVWKYSQYYDNSSRKILKSLHKTLSTNYGHHSLSEYREISASCLLKITDLFGFEALSSKTMWSSTLD